MSTRKEDDTFYPAGPPNGLNMLDKDKLEFLGHESGEFERQIDPKIPVQKAPEPSPTDQVKVK